MSVAVAPVAVAAAGPVRVAQPSRQPGDFSHVVLDNATPYVVTILNGGNGRAIPPYTSDKVVLDSTQLVLSLAFLQVPGGPVNAPQSYLAATFYTDDDELPDALPAPLTTQLISATIAAGSTVGIAGNVPVIGAVASQTVASGAQRTVVSRAVQGGSGTLTTTVVAASAQIIECHTCVATFVQGTGAGGPARLIRSDTGADILTPIPSDLSSVPAGTYQLEKDFQGAQIPAGVAIQSTISGEGFGPQGTLTIDLSYALIG